MIHRLGKHARRSAGITMVEVVVSTLLVGTLLVSTMNLLTSVWRNRQQSESQSRGSRLAVQLMTEILSRSYADPNEPTVLLGLETSELLASNRSAYDDVDDYSGLSESPPRYADGTAIPNTAGYVRKVEVVYINLGTLTVSLTPTGIKRITVTIWLNDEKQYEMIALRTDAWTPVSQEVW